MFSDMLQKKPRNIFKPPKQEGQIGIELELEGRMGALAADTLPRSWHVKPEGSLRGGYEFVTVKAGALKNVLEKVKTLADYFTSIGIVVNAKAYRGSTHIHVNVQEETFHHVLGCLVVFTAIEPLFLRLCGPSRNGNLFCMSSYDTGDLFFYTKSLVRAIRGGNFGAWPARGKYASLNFETIQNFGSIEFRCFPTSISPDEISRWCNWCVEILNTVKLSKDRAFYDVLNKALANPTGIAGSLFGAAAIADIPAKDLRDLVSLGCETAYEMAGVIASEFEREEAEQAAGAATKIRTTGGEQEQVAADLAAMVADMRQAEQDEGLR